jgi:hypothetical protein
MAEKIADRRVLREGLHRGPGCDWARSTSLRRYRRELTLVADQKTRAPHTARIEVWTWTEYVDQGVSGGQERPARALRDS